jgi:Rrf2 family nitric oxide-sensitive transcriptional repressor
MQLTQYTDYALRTLIYLAITDENVTITQIADHYMISRNHLVKVVHNLGEVVRRTEPNFHLVECFDASRNQCVITPACRLMGILGEAFAAFTSVIDQYTLEDVTRNAPELRKLLTIGGH